MEDSEVRRPISLKMRKNLVVQCPLNQERHAEIIDLIEELSVRSDTSKAVRELLFNGYLRIMEKRQEGTYNDEFMSNIMHRI